MRNGRARAWIRGKTNLFNWKAKESGPFQANSRGELCVVQALPRQTEITRLGNSWMVTLDASSTTTTSLPPNQGGLTIWNGELPGGKSYIIDTIFISANSLVATLVLGMGVQLSTNNPIPTLPFPSPYNIFSMSGSSTGLNNSLNSPPYNGKAVFAGTDSTLLDSGGWHQVGSAILTAETNNPNFSNVFFVYGRYVVEPRGKFSTKGLSNVIGGIVCKTSIYWHEVQLPLG